MEDTLLQDEPNKYISIDKFNDFLKYKNILKKFQLGKGAEKKWNQNYYVYHYGKLYQIHELRKHFLLCDCDGTGENKDLVYQYLLKDSKKRQKSKSEKQYLVSNQVLTQITPRRQRKSVHFQTIQFQDLQQDSYFCGAEEHDKPMKFQINNSDLNQKMEKLNYYFKVL